MESSLGSQGHHGATKHSSNSRTSSVMLLWMILDGVGLATILVCTFFEGYDLWHLIFKYQWDFNQGSLLFWFGGRTLQMIGLVFLITHAATFQIFHIFEFLGMALLTAGPILNLFSCSLIHMHNLENAFVFRRKWMIAELLELIGILFLDLSLIDTKPYLVLSAEVLGFAILAVASMLELIFVDNDLSKSPIISYRADPIHTSDCGGLFMLTLVAIGQYRMKVMKTSKSLSLPHYYEKDAHNNRSPTSSISEKNSNFNAERTPLVHHRASTGYDQQGNNTNNNANNNNNNNISSMNSNNTHTMNGINGHSISNSTGQTAMNGISNKLMDIGIHGDVLLSPLDRLKHDHTN